MNGYESIWFCKHCMTFHEHKHFNVESNDDSAVIMSGECQECKQRNNNYFPKQKANPKFGVGVTDPIA